MDEALYELVQKEAEGIELSEKLQLLKNWVMQDEDSYNMYCALVTLYDLTSDKGIDRAFSFVNRAKKSGIEMER